MRFSLQDVKKSIQRRGGELVVSLHFLRSGELQKEIARLIAYYEQQLGLPQRLFSLDEARACVGDYRMAHCLLATLSHWYSWQGRAWDAVLSEQAPQGQLEAIGSPLQLRLALFDFVNEEYQGFLVAAQRDEALRRFASLHSLEQTTLEYLLVLDSEEEALLTRTGKQPPTPAEVAAIYNQWTFEAALFNASNVHFVIDCTAFSANFSDQEIGSGVGAIIKRLCFLARKLGVYYDLAYESASSETGSLPLLHLILYGPQEVTGTPQQYGLRLARLCRLLLNYGTKNGNRKGHPELHKALVRAEATVHFLQRSYTFSMDSALLQLFPSSEPTTASEQSTVFDSSIEQSFAEAFSALAQGHGVDGWSLEREPEPLLLEQSIFIPDFALTRGERRIYVEILGFWTPAYRERKLQKLQQLTWREDLVLLIPQESRESFAAIADRFPIVYYSGQISVSELLHVLRQQYDDFAERLESLDRASLRRQVFAAGLLPERACYTVLRCYRRNELQRAAELITTSALHFLPGLGLYSDEWLQTLHEPFLDWMRVQQTVPLEQALQELRTRAEILRECEDAALETLLGQWSELTINRDSIFDAVLELVGHSEPAPDVESELPAPVRERKPSTKKRARVASEMQQSDLWG